MSSTEPGFRRRQGNEAGSPRLEAAVAAALRGWSVSPLSPGSKIPAIKRWEAFATTDLTQLQTWWSRNPNYNIGIAGRACRR